MQSASDTGKRFKMSDFWEHPEAKLSQNCGVPSGGSWGSGQTWRWAAALGHRVQFGLLPQCVAQPGLADVFSLAKETVVCPFLSMG